MKSKAKCLKVAEKALEDGKSVVIDNTNPGKAVRKEYYDLAKKYGNSLNGKRVNFAIRLSS